MPRDLETAFDDCFFVDYRTILVGGGAEPIYFPSADPTRTPHRVIYREDYFASALHEVAHWCLAGAARRTREDYGYWYAPDGRSTEQQADFEQAEVEPQALEWILSDACGFDFHFSVDNLSAGLDSSHSFDIAVTAKKARLVAAGLPTRARAYCRALEDLIAPRRSQQDFHGSSPATHQP